MKSLSAQKTVAMILFFALVVCCVFVVCAPSKVASASSTPQAVVRVLPASELHITAVQDGVVGTTEYDLEYGVEISVPETENADYEDYNVDFTFVIASGAVDVSKIMFAGQYDHNGENWVVLPGSAITDKDVLVMGDEIRVIETLIGNVTGIEFYTIDYAKAMSLIKSIKCGIIDISEDGSAFAPGTGLEVDVNMYETEIDPDTGNRVETGKVESAGEVDKIKVEDDLDDADWPETELIELSGDELNVILADDSTMTLDYGYKFVAKDDSVDGKIYAGWNVDFVLTVQEGALYTDKIVLAGQYNSYGDKWVALPLKDLIEENKLEEGDSVRLLQAAGMENVTYADVVNLIKTFQCGLKDVSADKTGSSVDTIVSVELVMYKVFGGVELNEEYSINTQSCDVEGKADASVEIESIEINADGELVIKYSDGTELNLGSVKGEKGDRGTAGVDGVDGADGNNAKALSIVAIVISAIAVIIMLYVAIVVTSKMKKY